LALSLARLQQTLKQYHSFQFTARQVVAQGRKQQIKVAGEVFWSTFFTCHFHLSLFDHKTHTTSIKDQRASAGAAWHQVAVRPHYHRWPLQYPVRDAPTDI
jgi:hypothetical protein